MKLDFSHLVVVAFLAGTPACSTSSDAADAASGTGGSAGTGGSVVCPTGKGSLTGGRLAS